MDRVRGTNPRREGTQAIMWLGAEDVIRCWDFEYYVVCDPRKGKTLASEMTKREAWDFLRGHVDREHLVIENWVGGGNSEASDENSYRVWAGPLALPE